ncbi:cytochrome P450 [Chaetomium fimeti]|uniref:Cytochrome P450 n=1 Tax=Chaetomium fimeti TaxID=1854472 RepID=A0AAE0HH99_9PEZI|nr:cytochrome P450 [Chaetomium fimeti]
MWQRVVETYAELVEQYMVIRESMSTLRLSRSELALLTIRKSWHDVKLGWQDWRDHPSRSIQLAVLTMAVFGAVVILDKIILQFTSLRRYGLPVLKRPKGVHRWDYAALLQEGARRYPDTPYILTYSGYEYIVYPSSSFDEIKRLPASQASMIEWFTHVFFQGWRFLGHESSSLYKTVGVDLTRAVPSYVQERQQHARRAFELVTGPCSDWKPFALFQTAMDLIAITNATGLVGPELGIDQRWRKAVQRFVMAMMGAIFASHAVPGIIRRAISPIVFTPAWCLYYYMSRLLLPIIRDELGTHKPDQDDTKSGMAPLEAKADGTRNFPMIKWLMARYKVEEATPRQVAHDLIVASFESTPSMAGTLYMILSELVIRPALIEEIRDELSRNMVDGRLPQTNLGELKKLDSVMRESSRVNPFGYLTLFRRLKQPVQLSVGPRLPVGSLICVDAYHIGISEALWTDPKTFDPMRFLKLRQQPGHEAMHQFTSLGADSPGWGDGLQACPGRAFAGNTLKIVLAHLLMNYDIKLPSRAEKPKRFSMPNGSLAPDMNAQLLLRKRRIKVD